MGYHRAGFDVVGVDLAAQPHYPFPFVQGYWSEAIPDGFDMIHASPPCQAYSTTRHSHGRRHPDLLPTVRHWLMATGRPYVIENVYGAPMPSATVLCGAAFGLKAFDPATGTVLTLRRHRWFESNVPLWGPGGCWCKGKRIGGVYGGGSSDNNHAKHVRRGGYTPATAVAKELMGIDWMPYDHLTQAIPPAYTEFIGAQLIAAL